MAPCEPQLASVKLWVCTVVQFVGEQPPLHKSTPHTSQKQRLLAVCLLASIPMASSYSYSSRLRMQAGSLFERAHVSLVLSQHSNRSCVLTTLQVDKLKTLTLLEASELVRPCMHVEWLLLPLSGTCGNAVSRSASTHSTVADAILCACKLSCNLFCPDLHQLLIWNTFGGGCTVLVCSV